MSQHITTISHAVEAIRDVCGINKGSVTFTEIVEAVIALKQDNECLHAHDATKAVHGWIKVDMCTGCGATYSLEQLAEIAPQAVSCCPERDMRPTLVPANYGSVTEAARDNFIEQVANSLHCPKHVNGYPNILTALHDVIDNSAKKSAEIRELTKERDGLQNTNRLINAELDGVCALVGQINIKEASDAIEKMQRDAQAMALVRNIICPIPSPHSLVSYLESIRDRGAVLEAAERDGLKPKVVFLPAGLEMKTADLIGNFAENLAQRLTYKQRQGYVGWDRDDWKDDCLRRLHTSDKPLDVAAFAVFAWYHDWSGSYEALVTMPGEFIRGETTVVHNHNITINIEGSVSGFELSGLLANYKKDEGPVGFRTE